MAPEPEPVGLKTYLLIRVGLDVGKEEWFGRKLEIEGGEDVGRPVEDGRAAEEGHAAGIRRLAGSRHPVGGKNVTEASRPARSAYPVEGSQMVDPDGAEGRAGAGLFHPLRALRQRRRDRQKAKWEQKLQAARERERERKLAVRARTIEEVEAAIGRLAREIEEYADSQKDCYYVYEDSIRRVLTGEKTALRSRRTEMPGEEPAETDLQMPILPVLWQKHFQAEEFRGYTQQFWVERLLPRAAHPHFIILGTAPCLFDVIEKCANRMKSLRWILPETDCDEELLGFVEDFCTEYGLAIMLEPLQGAAELKRLRLTCPQPVNVLDFTGEAYMAVSDIPKGSVWLDMFSVEEKQRRIIARGTGITYVSLKEKWKTVQRRCTCPTLP